MISPTPIPSPTKFARWLFSGRSAIERGMIATNDGPSLGDGRRGLADTRRTYAPAAV